MSSIHKIKIEDIEQAPSKKLDIEFDDKLEEILTKGNIKASLEVKSLGEYIKISGDIDLTAILECDLCLKEYEEEISIYVEEMYAKDKLMEEYGQELELKDGQFITDLEGEEEIDIEDLLYQSVIINLPNKKVCGINCREGFFETDETYQIPDERMEIFKTINVERK